MQLYYIETLKTPTCFDPYGIIISECVHQIVLKKASILIFHTKSCPTVDRNIRRLDTKKILGGTTCLSRRSCIRSSQLMSPWFSRFFNHIPKLF